MASSGNSPVNIYKYKSTNGCVPCLCSFTVGSETKISQPSFLTAFRMMSPTAQEVFGYTSLSLASSVGHVKVVNLLMARSPRIEPEPSRLGGPALEFSTVDGFPKSDPDMIIMISSWKLTFAHSLLQAFAKKLWQSQGLRMGQKAVSCFVSKPRTHGCGGWGLGEWIDYRYYRLMIKPRGLYLCELFVFFL